MKLRITGFRIDGMRARRMRLFEKGKRLPDLRLEGRYRGLGYSLIAGIDEAGRGPLAGPVIAAAVILPEDIADMKWVKGVRDSKRLCAREREEIYKRIMDKALAVGIGESDSREIDELNIFRATLLAMERAVKALTVEPDFCLVDGKHPLDCIKSEAIVKGDMLCLSIASASIVAKVVRDRKMLEYDKIYPDYQFRKNKGYGTLEHRRALLKYGPCEIHRKSFAPVRMFLERGGMSSGEGG